MADDDEKRRHTVNLHRVLKHFCEKRIQARSGEICKVTSAMMSDETDIDEPTLSRLLNGRRAWSDDSYQKALTYLRKFPDAATLQLRDLQSTDAETLVEKIVRDTQEKHRLLSQLEPNPRNTIKDGVLDRFAGFYAGAYLCRNPDNTDEPAVSIDAFSFKTDERCPEELFVEQTNFKHKENFVPTGRLRIRTRILEIDVNYMADYPAGKFLAPMPEQDADGNYNFIATMLDVKIKSRLVVARPIMFVQIDDAYRVWKAHPAKSKLYRAVCGFLEKNAQFEQSNFELCPTREARLTEWRPVIKEIKAVIAGSHQRP